MSDSTPFLGGGASDNLDILDPQQRKVLELRFGLINDGQKFSRQEIADQLGLTVDQVENFENEALEVLRNSLTQPEPKENRFVGDEEFNRRYAWLLDISEDDEQTET